MAKLNNLYFMGVVNDRHSIAANSINQIKRLASRYANNTFNYCDKLYIVKKNNRDENTEPVYFYRMNQIRPNNTIIRGKWR